MKTISSVHHKEDLMEKVTAVILERYSAWTNKVLCSVENDTVLDGKGPVQESIGSEVERKKYGGLWISFLWKQHQEYV